MTRWDQAAERELYARARMLSEAGVIDYVHSLTNATWQANVDRYEPDELGDTARGLGFVSAENINSRLAKEVTPGSLLWGTGVRLRTPNGAKRLEYSETLTSIVKAPSATIHTPNWSLFDWSSRATRSAAAAENDATWTPVSVEDDIDPLFELPRSALSPMHAFIVWAGFLTPYPSTAGWLGFPTNARGSWTAVVPLWRDQHANEEPVSSMGDESSAAFDALAGPMPVLRPKRTIGEQRETAR